MSNKGRDWGTERFSEIVAKLGPAAVGRKATNYRRELYRRADLAIGYEGFRQMVEGETSPRPDVMEAIAKLFKIDPREILEYRVWQISQTVTRWPKQTGSVYDAAMLIEKRMAGGADPE